MQTLPAEHRGNGGEEEPLEDVTDHDLDIIWFQQDDATAHTSRRSMDEFQF
jgi:hypothetical protein